MMSDPCWPKTELQFKKKNIILVLFCNLSLYFRHVYLFIYRRQFQVSLVANLHPLDQGHIIKKSISTQ